MGYRADFVQLDLTAWAKAFPTKKDRRATALTLQGRRGMATAGKGLLNRLEGEGEEDGELDEGAGESFK